MDIFNIAIDSVMNESIVGCVPAVSSDLGQSCQSWLSGVAFIHLLLPDYILIIGVVFR